MLNSLSPSSLFIFLFAILHNWAGIEPEAATMHTTTTLQRHNTENSKQIFPGKELSGYSPNSYIHVSVIDLYIPPVGLPFLLQENRWAKRGNIQIA
jgi:hypothetical protein